MVPIVLLLGDVFDLCEVMLQELIISRQGISMLIQKSQTPGAALTFYNPWKNLWYPVSFCFLVSTFWHVYLCVNQFTLPCIAAWYDDVQKYGGIQTKIENTKTMSPSKCFPFTNPNA